MIDKEKLAEDTAREVVEEIKNNPDASISDILREAEERMKKKLYDDKDYNVEQKQKGMARTKEVLEMILKEYDGNEVLVVGRIIKPEKAGEASNCMGIAQGSKVLIMEVIQAIMDGAGITIEHLRIAEKVGLFKGRFHNNREAYEFYNKNDER